MCAPESIARAFNWEKIRFKALRQDNYNATELEAWIDAGLDGMTRTAVQIVRLAAAGMAAREGALGTEDSSGACRARLPWQDAEIVPAQQYPCPAAEVRELVADLRDDIPALNRTERVQMVISSPTISVQGFNDANTTRPCTNR